MRLIGTPVAWIYDDEGTTLALTSGTPLFQHIINFSYEYSEEGDELCEIELHFTNWSEDYDLPYFQYGTNIMVQWGIIIGTNNIIKSPTRMVVIRDIVSEYGTDGTKMILRCTDRVSYLRQFRGTNVPRVLDSDVQRELIESENMVSLLKGWTGELNDFISNKLINGKQTDGSLGLDIVIGKSETVKYKDHKIPTLGAEGMAAINMTLSANSAIKSSIDKQREGSPDIGFIGIRKGNVTQSILKYVRDLYSDDPPDSLDGYGSTIVDTTDNLVLLKKRNFNNPAHKIYSFSKENGELLYFKTTTNTARTSEKSQKTGNIDPNNKSLNTHVSITGNTPFDAQVEDICETMDNISEALSSIDKQSQEKKNTEQQLEELYNKHLISSEIELFITKDGKKLKYNPNAVKTKKIIEEKRLENSSINIESALNKAYLKSYKEWHNDWVKYAYNQMDIAKLGATNVELEPDDVVPEPVFNMPYLITTNHKIIDGISNWSNKKLADLYGDPNFHVVVPKNYGTSSLSRVGLIRVDDYNYIGFRKIPTTELGKQPYFYDMVGDAVSILKSRIDYMRTTSNNEIDRIQRQYEAEAKVYGDPLITKGNIYEFENVNKRDRGKWYCTNAKHSIGMNSEYVVTMKLVRKPTTILSTHILSSSKIIYNEENDELEQVDKKVITNTSSYYSKNDGVTSNNWDELNQTQLTELLEETNYQNKELLNYVDRRYPGMLAEIYQRYVEFERNVLRNKEASERNTMFKITQEPLK